MYMQVYFYKNELRVELVTLIQKSSIQYYIRGDFIRVYNI